MLDSAMTNPWVENHFLIVGAPIFILALLAQALVFFRFPRLAERQFGFFGFKQRHARFCGYAVLIYTAYTMFDFAMMYFDPNWRPVPQETPRR